MKAEKGNINDFRFLCICSAACLHSSWIVHKKHVCFTLKTSHRKTNRFRSNGNSQFFLMRLHKGACAYFMYPNVLVFISLLMLFLFWFFFFTFFLTFREDKWIFFLMFSFFYWFLRSLFFFTRDKTKDECGANRSISLIENERVGAKHIWKWLIFFSCCFVYWVYRKFRFFFAF